MALPPHVSISYKPRSDGAAIKITTQAQYEQLMTTIQRGAKPYYISVTFESDMTTRTVRAYYKNGKDEKDGLTYNDEYEIETEDHKEERTDWIKRNELRSAITARIPQLV